jgi:single-strand DNA-binding protein
VFVEGRLIADPATGGPRLWTRQDGSPAASFELLAELVRFLGGKNGDGNGNGEPAEVAAAEEEQIPF